MKQVILGRLTSQGTVHRHTPHQTGTLPQLRAALSTNTPDCAPQHHAPHGTQHDSQLYSQQYASCEAPCQSNWQAKLLAKLPANLPDFISGYLPC